MALNSEIPAGRQNAQVFEHAPSSPTVFHLAAENKLVLAKFHENRLRIAREIGEKHALGLA